MLVPGVETLAETMAFRNPGDCSVLVQNLRPHLVGNGFIRSAFLEAHYCTYGYVFCGSPARNVGGNHIVSHSGRLCYISVKSASAPCMERIYPFRFFNSALALLLYVYCGSPVRNVGGNSGVSHPGGMFYISAKIFAMPRMERIYPFRFSAPLSSHSAAAADEEQDEHQQQKHRDRADDDRCELLLTAQLLRLNGLRLGLFKPCLALRNERHGSVDRAVTGG